MYCITHYLDKKINHDVTDSMSPRTKRLRSSQDLSTHFDDSISRMYQSQPVPSVNTEVPVVEEAIEARNGFCFSQPAMLDDLILCTQLNPTQGASQNPFQRLVRRMTRFFVSTKCDESLKRLTQCLEKLGCTWKANDEGIVSLIIILFSHCFDFINDFYFC